MKIVVGVGVPRAVADRVDLASVRNSVTNGLRADGIALASPVFAQNNTLDGPVASALSVVAGERSSIKVGLSVAAEQLSSPVMRNITARCLQAILHSTGYLSQSTACLNALAPNGSSRGSVHLLSGEPSSVERIVSPGTGEPFLGSNNPISQGTVVGTTGTVQRPGDVSPSGAGRGLQSAGDSFKMFLDDARAPAIAVGVTVGIVAIAAIVWKVAR